MCLIYVPFSRSTSASETNDVRQLTIKFNYVVKRIYIYLEFLHTNNNLKLHSQVFPRLISHDQFLEIVIFRNLKYLKEFEIKMNRPVNSEKVKFEFWDYADTYD